MAKSSEVMGEGNLFILIEYRRFLSAMYQPQPVRSEVFDPYVGILTNLSYIFQMR